MRSGSIKVAHIGVEYSVELLLMQDEQMVETLAPHTSEKPFTDGICSWGLIGYFENLNSTYVHNTGEVHPELAIVITNEILRSLSKRGGFSQLLGDPHIAGRPRHTYVDHFA
jgi:hypothetical protein